MTGLLHHHLLSLPFLFATVLVQVRCAAFAPLAAPISTYSCDISNKSCSRSSSFQKPWNSNSIASLAAAAQSSVPAAVAAANNGGTARLAIAGKIAPFLSKLTINAKKTTQISMALQKQTNIADLIAIAVVGWFSEPIVRFIYETFIEKWRKKDFDKTNLFYTWKLGSEVARIAAIVYAVDILDITLSTLGINFAIKCNLGDFAASILYTAWVGRKLSIGKKKYVLHEIKKQNGGNKRGRFFLYNRIFDIIITIGTIFSIADQLRISTSNAFSRVFALGSIGTVILSLATKSVAEQFVGGLALSTTDKFFENDVILLGDNTSGKVTRVGWMSTDIRRGDETVIRIPNSQIANQRVTNLSRTNLSQVKQTLRFKYDDIDKIPRLVNDIKEEVKHDCPKLITDGSRPCRVFWSSFNDDHIEVNVDFRFNIPMVGDKFHQNRQNCYIAIAKAMKKNGVEFAIPASFNYEYSVTSE